MVFTSLAFFLYLTAAFAAYWIMPKKPTAQNLTLIVLGLIFYASWDWRALVLICLSSLITYYAAYVGKKFVIVLAVIVLLGVLGIFKYANFFLGSIGLDVRVNLVLPIGISFYTFMAISYLVDVSTKKILCERNPLIFISHMMFFPQIAAGPIGRADKMLPQYRDARTFNYPMAVEGCRQMLWGFFKKILVADTSAVLVNQLLVPGQTAFVGLWVGAILFTVQIYADFSGYSDIAIGCGKLFGIRLTRNFMYPYFAKDIVEFWRRWHISLTSWFRDYVYIPLGGGRCRIERKFINTMVVFLFSGLWHGANWTFVFWGALHGIFFLPVMLRSKRSNPLPFCVSWPIMMLAVVVGWIVFFAPSIDVALFWLKYMFLPIDLSIKGLGLGHCMEAFLFGALMFVVEWFGRNCEVIQISSKRCVRLMFYVLVIFSILWFYPAPAKFIYFRF